MRPASGTQQLTAAAVMRLDSLCPLDEQATKALHHAMHRVKRYQVRREMMIEGRAITETLLILSGWAARVRILEDGRRQIINFLLPGDLVGLCDHDQPIASSTVVAITEVNVCKAPDPDISASLAQAYARGRAHEDAYLLSQITRLGRLNAQERFADLLLELFERLERAGLAAHGRYTMPLTQEVIADALGLTSVHVNRTLQGLRRDGLVNLRGREVHLTAPDALRCVAGRLPMRVTAT